MEVTEKKTDLEVVQSSLKVLQAVNDQTVVAEADKMERAINNLVATNKPMVEAYAEELKAFDQSIVSKYGLPAARVIEFILVALMALKMYYAG